MRELENAIERALVLGQDDVIRPADLPDTLAPRRRPPSRGARRRREARRDGARAHPARAPRSRGTTRPPRRDSWASIARRSTGSSRATASGPPERSTSRVRRRPRMPHVGQYAPIQWKYLRMQRITLHLGSFGGSLGPGEILGARLPSERRRNAAIAGNPDCADHWHEPGSGGYVPNKTQGDEKAMMVVPSFHTQRSKPVPILHDGTRQGSW